LTEGGKEEGQRTKSTETHFSFIASSGKRAKM